MSFGLQGLAYFPGIEQIISAVYTLAHGITPGVIQIEMAPQASFTAEIGPVVFSYGDVQLEFDNCKVDAASFDVSSGGFLWRLQILDRRWLWAFGQISGHYNQYNGDGTIKTETKQTPTQLCTLCLEAMNEQEYDVSQVPSSFFPTVDWDYAVPAQALAALCDELGCHVVLQLDGTVAILPTGSGEELPYTNDLQADSLTIDPPEKPDSLVIVGEPTLYQVDLPLRAVGWNTDNTIQPLQKLSYAPDPSRIDGGFHQIDATYFNGITDPVERTRAAESIFRWYQIDPTAIEEIPGYEEAPITDIRQILPIGTQQVDTDTETSLGETITRNKPAAVFGVWFDFMRSTEDENTVPELVPLGDGTSDQDKKITYGRPFEIDAENGLVKFAEPVYMKVNPTSMPADDEGDEDEEDDEGDDSEEDGGESEDDGDGDEEGEGEEAQLEEDQQTEQEQSGSYYGPADLRLRTSVLVRDAKTWAVDRYEREREQDQDNDSEGDPGTQPRYIIQDDIQLTKTPDYGDDYSEEPQINDNHQACDQEADYYLDAAEAEYDTPAPQARTYAGLKPIDLDGAIMQVTWSVSEQGATTAASRSNDRTPYTIPYAQRRLTEKTVASTSKKFKEPKGGFKSPGSTGYSGGGVG